MTYVAKCPKCGGDYYKATGADFFEELGDET